MSIACRFQIYIYNFAYCTCTNLLKSYEQAHNIYKKVNDIEKNLKHNEYDKH
jgi:hypothetical protein